MKKNNKGFVITGFLYSILVIFIVILSMLMIAMINSKLILNKIKNDVKTSLDEENTNDGVYERFFSYTGSSQTFTAPYSGWYEIELWGAQGGNTRYNANGTGSIVLGGKGSYINGKIFLTANQTLYIYIGGKGQDGGTLIGTQALGGYNGGGAGLVGGTSEQNSGGGGGSTDIRITSGAWNSAESLASRIMVASGGAGASNWVNAVSGGAGGCLIGLNGQLNVSSVAHTLATGGTQKSGGTAGGSAGVGMPGVFGAGGASNVSHGSGGGSGYYGGGGSGYISSGVSSGAGGSSFISGYAGVNGITSSSSTTPTGSTLHYSSLYFLDGYMEAGVNEGNGMAKISYFSDTDPVVTNENLNNVRYIKDCINGSSSDSDNHWVELQAIKNGVNLAKGKTVTGTSTVNGATYITDGDITTTNYTFLSTGLQCVILDLGAIYDLDEIAVWHYYGDSRTYNSNVTYASIDNSNWTSVISVNTAENSQGKRVNAYEE